MYMCIFRYVYMHSYRCEALGGIKRAITSHQHSLELQIPNTLKLMATTRKDKRGSRDGEGMYLYVCVCICICVWMYMLVCGYCTYMYIHISMYMYIHMYVYMNIFA
jgi:Flp pilus assembly protein TadB